MEYPYTPSLSPDLPNMGSVLKGLGYRTAYFGKVEMDQTLLDVKPTVNWSRSDTVPPRFVRPSRPRFRCRWIAPHLNEGALLTERQNEVRGNGDTGAEASQALAEETRYQVSNRALHRCACPATDFRARLCGVRPSRYAPHSSAAGAAGVLGTHLRYRPIDAARG
jgi:hypothetical protein